MKTKRAPGSAGDGDGARDGNRAGLVARWVCLAAMLAAVVLRDGPGLAAERTRQAAAPFAFSLLDWEVAHLAPRLGRLIQAVRGMLPAGDAVDQATVRAYFELPPAARPSRRPEAEQAIERLVTDAWRAEGLMTPSQLAGGQSIIFPPVSFTFADPPQVLIMSPRDRIEVKEYALLRPSLNSEDVALLEDGVAARGLSTLVTPIGGLATYPAIVLQAGSATASLAAVAHEWVHAYFFFQPLGRQYWADQDMRTINETAAELAGAELGERLGRTIGLPAPPPTAERSPRLLEFNGLMRQTRLEVDRLLALGQVDAAEQYMEQQRQALNARGFGIRRLNQAYFAFYGSYAESPAGSSPIAGQVRRLRSLSADLGQFLRTIAQVSDPRELGVGTYSTFQNPRGEA